MRLRFGGTEANADRLSFEQQQTDSITERRTHDCHFDNPLPAVKWYRITKFSSRLFLTFEKGGARIFPVMFFGNFVMTGARFENKPDVFGNARPTAEFLGSLPRLLAPSFLALSYLYF